MKFKKIILFLIICLTCCLFSSCAKQTYNVSFDSNGGTEVASQKVTKTSKINKPTNPVKEGWVFVEWQLDGKTYDFSQVVDKDVELVAKWSKKEYATKWDLNITNWDGQNMSFKIMVDSLEFSDPFNENYVGANQKSKQSHQRLVEAAYNINIIYEEYEEKFGVDRVVEIKNKYFANQYNGIYALEVNSSWLRSLAVTNMISKVENNNDNNLLMVVSSNTYGISLDDSPKYFMYYNKNIIESLEMEDPLKLWFNGKWTWDNFETYIDMLASKITNEQKVFKMDYMELLVGLSASLGNTLISSLDDCNLLDENFYNIIDKVKTLYTKGYIVVNANVNDSVFINCSNDNNNTHLLNDATSEFGIVPYPTATGNGGLPITTPDSNSDKIVYDYDGNPICDDNGNYIIGLDLTNSTYKLPNTSVNCYALVNNYDDNINSSITSSIINDLIKGYDSSYEFTKTTYDYLLDSVLNNTYTELTVTLSNRMSVGIMDGYLSTLNYALSMMLKNNSTDISNTIKDSYLFEMEIY